MRAPLKESGREIVDSIQRTFDAGGRPAWPGLAKSTLRTPGSILNRSGRLRGSFEPHVEGQSVSADSDTVYGPRQNFGYDPAGKTGPGQVKTPARRFAYIPDEDVPLVVDPLKRYLWGR
jgi:phage gpG-like protein